MSAPIHWAVFDATGAAIAINVVGEVASDVAAQFAAGARVVRQSARAHDRLFQTVRAADGTIIDDLPRARRWAIAAINAQRVREGSRAITPGESVQTAYRMKGEEAGDFAKLSAATLAALDLSARRQRFPTLMACAELRGVPLATIATEVAAGKRASEAAIRRTEARCDLAKQHVATATTSAAIIAATQIDWS